MPVGPIAAKPQKPPDGQAARPLGAGVWVQCEPAMGHDRDRQDPVHVVATRDVKGDVVEDPAVDKPPSLVPDRREEER